MFSLIEKLIGLVSIFVYVETAAVEPFKEVDFYKLFDNPNAHLNVTPRTTTSDHITMHGYPAEKHTITTEDGYQLCIFRIPYSHKLKNQEFQRPVVLLQHGLFTSSDEWVLIGPKDALPFLLADAGYDVWIGNSRGNTYSRSHTTLSTEHPYFWRFSWHEMGKYDLPAMIDYALATNGQGHEAVHYVGHSQGTTSFLVFLSLHPKYNTKIKTAHMLAPVAFLNHLRYKLVRLTASYLGHHNIYSELFSSQEFLPYNDFVLLFLYNVCHQESKFKQFCEATDNETSKSRRNTTIKAEYTSVWPAGISTNQLLHYLQEQQSGRFRQYDHGTEGNLKMYGTETPPDYEFENITAEIHLWYSDSDTYADVEDVLHLASMLFNKVMHRMEDPLWEHDDYTRQCEVRKYINEPIITIIENYENKNRSYNL